MITLGLKRSSCNWLHNCTLYVSKVGLVTCLVQNTSLIRPETCKMCDRITNQNRGFFYSIKSKAGIQAKKFDD